MDPAHVYAGWGQLIVAYIAVKSSSFWLVVVYAPNKERYSFFPQFWTAHGGYSAPRLNVVLDWLPEPQVR